MATSTCIFLRFGGDGLGLGLRGDEGIKLESSVTLGVTETKAVEIGPDEEIGIKGLIEGFLPRFFPVLTTANSPLSTSTSCSSDGTNSADFEEEDSPLVENNLFQFFFGPPILSGLEIRLL